MWKDTDFYSKRDDDSAIGDSENNSAEEESMNSRRKSSISDDIDEMTIDAHAQLVTKLDQKIPDCLLKSSEELIENCRKIQKTYASCKTKTKREIRVLPSAAAVIPRKVSNGAVKTATKDNTSILEAKFQYLLSEMKKVREMDQEILKTFLELNESVEEVRWKLTENEEDLKRKMAEEEEEDLCSSFAFELRTDDVTQHVDNYVNFDVTQSANNDVTHSSSNYENLDVTRNKNYENLDSFPSLYENADVITPMTKATASPAVSLRHSEASSHVSTNKTVPSLQSTSTPHSSSAMLPSLQSTVPPHSSSPMVSPAKHQNSSVLSNSTYAAIEIREQSVRTTTEHKRTSKQKAASPNKENSNRSPSDVWVVRDDFKTTRTERSSRKHASRNSIAVAPFASNINTPSPKPAADHSRRRRSEITQPQFRGRSNLGACSFRMVADENSRIGRLGQWTETERKVDSKPPSIHTQSSNNPHHAVGLSRFRGNSSLFQVGVTKPSESSSSLNSSSSRTSSESSNSVPPPPQNQLKRNNSISKWGRFFRRSSKSAISGLEKKPNGITINNNYKPSPAMDSKRISDPILNEANILPVSFKRTPDNTHRWTHHNDDITYL